MVVSLAGISLSADMAMLEDISLHASVMATLVGWVSSLSDIRLISPRDISRVVHRVPMLLFLSYDRKCRDRKPKIANILKTANRTKKSMSNIFVKLVGRNPTVLVSGRYD